MAVEPRSAVHCPQIAVLAVEWRWTDSMDSDPDSAEVEEAEPVPSSSASVAVVAAETDVAAFRAAAPWAVAVGAFREGASSGELRAASSREKEVGNGRAAAAFRETSGVETGSYTDSSGDIPVAVYIAADTLFAGFVAAAGWSVIAEAVHVDSDPDSEPGSDSVDCADFALSDWLHPVDWQSHSDHLLALRLWAARPQWVHSAVPSAD